MNAQSQPTVSWQRLRWSQLDELQRGAALRRPAQIVADTTRAAVAAIVAQVRRDGDGALRALGERVDLPFDDWDSP